MSGVTTKLIYSVYNFPIARTIDNYTFENFQSVYKN